MKLPNFDTETTVARLRSLTPAEICRLCDEFDLPTPTPDVDINRLLERAGLTIKDVWERLSTKFDPSTVILSAKIAGQYTILPPDPRLNPAPLPRTPRREPGSNSAPRISNDPAAPGTVIIRIGDCPHEPGSERARRFSAIRVGMTFAEARKAGAKTSDLERWASQSIIELGSVRKEEPEPQASEQYELNIS